MAHAPLFGSLSAESRIEIGQRAGVVAFSARQRLWRAGDAPTFVGVVLTGLLKIVQPVEARQVIVDVALPGEVVGEVAFALGLEHDSTVVCLRRARILLVPTDSLRPILAREHLAIRALGADLAGMVRRLRRRVRALTGGGVERRLARVLVGLAERAGEPSPGGVYLPLGLSRADLAALAATSRESVSRTISAWTRRGWIVARPAGYLLRNLNAVRRASDDAPSRPVERNPAADGPRAPTRWSVRPGEGGQSSPQRREVR